MAMAAEATGVPAGMNSTESTISWAEQMITTTTTTNAVESPNASIFLKNPEQARRLLFAVYNIHLAIKNSPEKDSDGSLIRALHLMDTAMKCLHKEFAELLQHNHDGHDVDASHSADHHHYQKRDSFAADVLDYLQATAECMIVSGYAHECVEIYKQSRRAVLEDGLSRLGVEHVTASQVQKLNWEALDFRITQWLAAGRAVFPEVFLREMALCSRVFAASQSIRDSCFVEITKDAAVEFFRFPQVMAAKSKRSTEKVLHYLDMYRTIKDLRPEIDAAFSYKSANAVRSQVDASLLELAGAIKSLAAEFESVVYKDTSKSILPGGDLHALTQSVMNHLVPLAEHAEELDELFKNNPLPAFAASEPKAAKEEAAAGGAPASPAATRFSWLITTLLCKLDVKAELYKDSAQSYLFLANNVQYVVNRVKESSNLARFLGADWVSSHEEKARSFARSFLRLAWKKVLEAVPDEPYFPASAEDMKERMGGFNRLFEEACRKQASWVVLDDKVRSEIKTAMARSLVDRYRPFYEKCRAEMTTAEGPSAVVRFAPQDLLSRVSGLYFRSAEATDWVGYSSASVSGASRKSGAGSLWKWLKESRHK